MPALVWIISLSFIVVLWLAHVFSGPRSALKLHISEMRSVTVLAHLLFLLLIGAALCYSRRAQAERRFGSTAFGLVLALSILVAWVTPTYSAVHNFFANAPFIALYVYVPLMLASSGKFFFAAVTMVLPPVSDAFCVFVYGSSGELQKLNALLFIAILNFLYYEVLGWVDPL